MQTHMQVRLADKGRRGRQETTAADGRPARGAGTMVSFEAECGGTRGPMVRARPGHEIRVVGEDAPERVIWSGPLLDGEVREGDRLQVLGRMDGRRHVHATRILNLTQGTVLRPAPRRLRALVAGGVIAAVVLGAVVVVAAVLAMAL